jgi:DNA helicase-2/ATP-dependent DNA helicase PcrA
MEDGLFPLQKAMDDPREMEEERRLCYVGMTRAKQKLYLSMAEYRKVYGFGEYHRASRFVEEIPKDYLLSDAVQQPLKPAYKPTFDYKRPLEIKTETQKNAGSDKHISTGDTIAHPAWGQGVVISVEASGQDNIITAAFAGLGIKKFLTGFAQIKKIK